MNSDKRYPIVCNKDEVEDRSYSFQELVDNPNCACFMPMDSQPIQIVDNGKVSSLTGIHESEAT